MNDDIYSLGLDISDSLYNEYDLVNTFKIIECDNAYDLIFTIGQHQLYVNIIQPDYYDVEDIVYYIVQLYTELEKVRIGRLN
jgi:hypothetical protein